jgi:hypothetical protein
MSVVRNGFSRKFVFRLERSSLRLCSLLKCAWKVVVQPEIALNLAPALGPA